MTRIVNRDYVSVDPTWRRLAFGCAIVMAAAVGYCLLRVPFEASEVAGNLLNYQAGPSAGRVVIDTFTAQQGSGTGFLRNFSLATGKFLFDVSGGHYFVVYRAFHLALISILLLTLVPLVNVRSQATFGLAVLSAAALLGMHTFHQAIRETETNIKLIVPACVFVILILSASKPARWKDFAAVVIAFYAFFSNELGLLAWVCLAAAYLVGHRGVSRGAVLGVTALLGMYLYLRFVQWHVGAPPMTERSSGFGFRSRDAPELIRLFGSNPYPFYLYNVVVSLLTVLFAEPRSGTFIFIRDFLGNKVAAGHALEVVSSAATTVMMAWYVVRRLPHWWRREMSDDDRLFLVAMAVLIGNAAISFPYAKEVVMSTGGAFYALAMFPAIRFLVMDEQDQRVWKAVTIYTLIACISLGWTVRAASLFVDLRRSAYRAQNDWVSVYDWMSAQHMPPPSAQGRQLLDRVRLQMLQIDVPRDYHESRLTQPLDPIH